MLNQHPLDLAAKTSAVPVDRNRHPSYLAAIPRSAHL